MPIRIEITHGSQFVPPTDQDCALDAAVAALGSVDPVAASAEFDRQVDANLGDTDGLTGLAEGWDRVQSAANRALTSGWRDPDGAACEVIAE